MMSDRSSSLSPSLLLLLLPILVALSSPLLIPLTRVCSSPLLISCWELSRSLAALRPSILTPSREQRSPPPALCQIIADSSLQSAGEVGMASAKTVQIWCCSICGEITSHVGWNAQDLKKALREHCCRDWGHWKVEHTLLSTDIKYMIDTLERCLHNVKIWTEV